VHAIEAEQLVKTYPGDVRALDGLSFTVPGGTVFAARRASCSSVSPTARLISLPLPRSFVDAKLTEAGLFYAYNTPKAATKGHTVFEPTAKLLRRF
jgi:hypothetical protein